MAELVHIDEFQIQENLPFPELIEALRQQFKSDINIPLRHHHPIHAPNEPEAMLLLMPVWNTAGYGGVKLVNVNPGNRKHNIPALSASYLLFDVKTGQHLALLDGGEITARRTAAASALAADYLAREDSRKLLLVGAGRVCQNLAHAYRHIRPIDEINIWNTNLANAQKFSKQLNAAGISATVVEDLETAVPEADIISCATLANEPLIRGEWLRPGQHLDLIGGFTPKMREADDEAVRRSSVFIDTDAALFEAGDIVKPIENKILAETDIAGSLFSLCRKQHAGRSSKHEITFFKAVGTALEDLAAATMAYTKYIAQTKVNRRSKISAFNNLQY